MTCRHFALLPLLLAVTAAHGAAQADPAVVEGATARATGAGWSFDVTLSHGDTGWNDYADGWRIEDVSGTVLGTRDLLHPHVDEQPFTRSLSGVTIPEGTETVYIRARTNVEGWGGTTLPLALD
jgi:hypothetical protein